MTKTRVALALGSGGARGYAHIGVIEELVDRGYDIVGISGSSMGALIGGLYAADALDDFSLWASGLTQRDVLRLLDVALTAPTVVRAERIFDIVRNLVGETVIEDLRIPFTAVATDLIAGRSVWFQRGSLVAAMRASIAIPGFISPHEVDGRLLADGGILDPLPVVPVVAVPADLIIAVDVGGEDPGDFHGTSEPGPVDELIDRFRRSTNQLLESDPVRSVLNRFGALTPDSDEAEEESAEENEPTPRILPKLGQFEIMNRSLDLMQAALKRHQLAAYPPDVLIEVPRTSARVLEFHRAEELVLLGRELTATALDQLVPPLLAK
ncbi:patatin-like phospholipase family protein [Antrihabitans stalactiti]|uniref:Esterase n=1 Tax=Antrihabitans stalactiti TaxID=2584121 RepID=A0A848KK08_9NOCA|nr:patatin-like phospholipase family protein [Antrihabitans stalactiti]NMN98188.1 esterase [Antrihabitans stalactiti]